MLLTRPFSSTDETLQSFLIRLARANHYTFEAWSRHLADQGIPYRTRNQESRKKLVEYIDGILGRNETSELFDQWAFYTDLKLGFDFARIKICPHCFKESKGKLHPKWSFRFNLTCPVHGCLLVDTCSCCGTAINEQAVHSHKCTECGTPLITSESTIAEPDSFSGQIHELDSTKLISDERNRTALINLLTAQFNTIEALSNYVYEGDQAKWRKKRAYSLAQRYQHQIAVSQALSSQSATNDAVAQYAGEVISDGETDIAKLFRYSRKAIKNQFPQMLIKAIKTYVENFDDDNGITVGLRWLSDLYGIDDDSLFKFVVLNHEALQTRKGVIRLLDAGHVIDGYLKSR
ncbi:TniQ family protein [Alteromonas sp. S015]|uniref:TniQ family protein n=1 Tax=Alteromonas sp. S015 TaxID=3117401 RepID=UPI002FE0B208